jgi:hypothetical protein
VGVAGSNPATPTKILQTDQPALNRAENGFRLGGQLRGQKRARCSILRAPGAHQQLEIESHGRTLATRACRLALAICLIFPALVVLAAMVVGAVTIQFAVGTVATLVSDGSR